MKSGSLLIEFRALGLANFRLDNDHWGNVSIISKGVTSYNS